MKSNKTKLAYCAIAIALTTALVAAPAVSAGEVSGRLYATCGPTLPQPGIECEYVVSSTLLPVSLTSEDKDN